MLPLSALGVLTVAFLLSMGSAAHALTLKIATLAPDGTTWMKDMRAAAEEIASGTDGRVKIKFYPGGVMGNDKAVMKKIRLGQLHGGAVTGGNLTSISPDMGAYSLPMVFRNYAEVDHIRPQLDPLLSRDMQEKGFTMLGITEGGFGYLMSGGPIRSATDLESHKLWIPEDDAPTDILFRKLGVVPTSLPLADVYTGLQTGLIDTIGSTPTGALALQWHTRINYVTDVPLMYLTGALIVSRKRFDAIKPDDQQIVRDVLTRAFTEMNQKNRADNAEAMKALVSLGIELVRPEESEVDHWRKLAAESIVETGNAANNRPFQVKLEALLAEFRAR